MLVIWIRTYSAFPSPVTLFRQPWESLPATTRRARRACIHHRRVARRCVGPPDSRPQSGMSSARGDGCDLGRPLVGARRKPACQRLSRSRISDSFYGSPDATAANLEGLRSLDSSPDESTFRHWSPHEQPSCLPPRRSGSGFCGWRRLVAGEAGVYFNFRA